MKSSGELEKGSYATGELAPVYDAQVSADDWKDTNVATFANNLRRGDSIPPKVEFRDRKYTDKPAAIVYIMSYLAFLITGFIIVGNAKARYVWNDVTLELSDHYRNKLNQCCNEKSLNSVNSNVRSNSYDLCEEYNQGGRRLAAGRSKFHGDESMFDAFLLAPEIIVGLLGTVIFLAIAWIVLLRFFAKPIVVATEFVKIGIFIAVGIYQKETGTRVFCFLIALGLLCYVIWAWKHIMFAAKMIKYSTIALKENPIMFVGCIVVKLFYVLNAFLFVLFFSKSFDVTNIEEVDQKCLFVRPSYINGIMIYSSLSYLWINLIFDKMRLSIIATIVGSWHFHPGDKPSILVAVKNTLTTSFGTLSVAALIATLAERINRMVNESVLKTWINPLICITWPFQLVLCCFAGCLNQCLRMLTKFAVICHVFTGENFMGSARNVFNIMSRHFKGGFITDLTSRGVLDLGCYIFSVGTWFLAWWWIDERFDCETLTNSSEMYLLVLWILFGLFNVWYPVLGIYCIIIVNMILVRLEQSYSLGTSFEKQNYQHYWIPPLAAAFVGCISMMFYTYVARIILDVIDTLFLCYAVDKDNDVDNIDSELKTLVEAVPVYGVIRPDEIDSHDVPFATDPTPVIAFSADSQKIKA